MESTQGAPVRGTYAYSLDHENFQGIYETRLEAAKAAFAHASRAGLPINQVYVGQRVLGDPMANLHAWGIVKAMRQRARESYGDAAGGYLADVTADQAEDLDRALEATLSRWLTNYKIGPTFFRIEAISEHPIPTVSQVADGDDDEVYDLGETNYF